MALIRYAQPGLHGDKEPEPNLSYEYIPKERYTSKEFMKIRVGPYMDKNMVKRRLISRS